MTVNNDTNDLEALFDSIAADFKPAIVEPIAVVPPAPAKTTTQLGDSDDLQALFDSIALENAPQVPSAGNVTSPSTVTAEADDSAKQERVFNRIGNMARVLHDTIGELGYDKLIEQTVSALPDAQDRLAYVANLTEQAACRVLNATDVAGPLIDGMESSSQVLGARWNQAFASQLSTAEFKKLAEETRLFFNDQLPSQVRLTRAQLTEIMMAQDFQDLTGQVIKKIVSLAQTLESGLMNVLIDIVPETKRTDEVNSLMNGPVVNAEGRADVVVNQEQVDDLLDSLGF